MRLVHAVVNSGEVEIMSTAVAGPELSRTPVDPDPLLERAIKDFDDGVAACEQDFEIVAGFV